MRRSASPNRDTEKNGGQITCAVVGSSIGWLKPKLERIRAILRRSWQATRRWMEQTSNLLHVSVVLVVPAAIALVTYLSDVVPGVSFLLFPPLASGTYTLVSEPHGRYANPVVFVGGLTAGALCGWVALAGSVILVGQGDGVSAVAAGSAVLLTAVVTWALSLETPTAFSTALLSLLTGGAQFTYFLGIVLSSTVVAGVFYLWREEVYEERARFLYGTTQADDQVLVPMRAEARDATTALGARLAAAHSAGKVVLLDIVPDETVAATESNLLDRGIAGDESEARAVAEAQAAADSAIELQARAERVQDEHGVPCEVTVAAGDPDDVGVVLDAADRANCDIIATPLESTPEGDPSPYVRRLFASDMDVVTLRSTAGATTWERPMVMIGKDDDVAHAMVDYAQRVATTVTIGTCIGSEKQRRAAESMLADIAETMTTFCETRVSQSDVSTFLTRADDEHDLVFVGASTDRSAASRFLTPPTYERINGIESDIAVVHLA